MGEGVGWPKVARLKSFYEKGIPVLDCFATPVPGTSIPIDLVTSAGFEAWAARRDPGLTDWLRAHDFKGQPARLVMLPDAQGGVGRVAFGLGAGDDFFLPAELPFLLRDGLYHFDDLGALPDHALAALAWATGCYRFEAYKSVSGLPVPRLAVPEGVNLNEVARIAEGIYLTRDLVNTPANDMGPAELERAARDLAERHGARFTAVVGDTLLENNYPLIHAVGRASSRPPRLLDMVWGPDHAPRLTLVGKGVCFDSGGLNIKTGGSMELMKKDMGGAAHVLGLAHMIMSLRVPVRLRVLIPAVENAISGNAFRPGDVFRARDGSTVEISNTDAEGRLVLADAIAAGDDEHPDMMLIMATLTGAARVALGPEIVPFYTDDRAFALDLMAHADRIQDPVWQMPLHKPYLALMESRVADINHISQGRFAGSITAALFLSRFVKKAARWAHFDLYAWNAQPRPGRPVGGEAQAIRSVLSLVQERYGG